MRINIAMLVAFVLVGTGLSIRNVVSGSAAPPGNQLVSPAAALTLPGVEDEAKYTYVGTNKCKKCHLPEYRSWAKTRMGKAFSTLKPGSAVEARKKHGLDPEKDYTTDESCLKCHTTGYGHEGGYAVPNPEDKKAVRRAKKLAGVGCESCHGPGSAYIKVFEDIFRSKRKYKIEELYAVGLLRIDASTCTDCHNDAGPTFDAAKPFNFERMKDEDIHEHRSLKQRGD